MHPPKSPKRFFTFSPHSNLPPLPSTSPSERNMFYNQSHAHHTPSSSYSSTSSNLGFGATVVRTPQEALVGMMKRSEPMTAGVVGSSKEVYESRESLGLATAPPTQTAPRSRRSASFSRPTLTIGKDAWVRSPVSEHPNDIKKERHPSLSGRHSSTAMRPPPQGPLPPLPPLPTKPFNATLLSVSLPPCKAKQIISANEVLLTLEFAYNLDEDPRNTPITLPFDVLKRCPGGGGHLVDFVENCLEADGIRLAGKKQCMNEADNLDLKPEMTDGSSAEDSDLDSEYGLGALLRDEYLLSLALTAPPTQETFFNEPPSPPPRPSTGKKRAQTRNQYTQLTQSKFPTPSSPLIPKLVSIPPVPPLTSPLQQPFNGSGTAPLTISKKSPDSVSPSGRGLRKSVGGRMIEIRLLLLRDAGPYHLLAHRLLTGSWGGRGYAGMEEGKRHRIREEVRWLGIQIGEGEDIMGEMMSQKSRERSLVLKGGRGYI